MSQPATRNHVAFVACSALAIAVIIGMWAWNVRALVTQGVSGTKQMFANVADTAGEVKERSAPDQETVDTIKAGIKTIISAPAEAETRKQETVGAVAEIMSGKLEEEGADGSRESEGSEDADMTEQPEGP